MDSHKDVFTQYLRESNRWGKNKIKFTDWAADQDFVQCQCCKQWGLLGNEVVYMGENQPFGEDTLLCRDCKVEAWG